MADKRFGESFFRLTSGFLVKHRNKLFLMMSLLIFGALFFAQKIKIDNSLELWFLEGDPALKAYHEFKDKYGNDEIILAMVDCRKDGMFSAEKLTKIYEASKAIEADKENFRRVLSVGKSPYIGLNGNELIIEDLIKNPVKTATEAQSIYDKFMNDPFKIKMLQAASNSYAIIIAEPVATKDMDERRPKIIKSMRDKLKGFDYKLAGMGVMYDELNRLSIRDGVVFNTVAYIVIATLIFALYRSWLFLLMVIGAMFYSGLAFIGAYGLFGQNFNMVTIVLPTLMMILSVSDVAYVYNNFCYNSSKVAEDKEKGLSYVFNEVLSPCLFTSLTNTCGFFALLASSLAVLRVFGVFAGFSCMAEYLVSMIVAVFILGFVKPQKSLAMRRPFQGAVSWWMQRMPKYYVHILVFTAISLSIAIYGITQLNVDTYSMGFLSKTNAVRQDSDKIEAIYGNYLPLAIRIITNKDINIKQDASFDEDNFDDEPRAISTASYGIKSPDFLRRLDKCHKELEALPGVQKAASIVDVLKKLNQVMTDGSRKNYKLPDSYSAVSQLLMLYESDDDNDLQYMTDLPYYKEARLTVRLPMVSAAKLKVYEQKVKKIIANNFKGTNVKYKFGGYVPLYSRIIAYVTRSQVTSFALALLFVFAAIAILFRNYKAILLAVLPNIYPILMTLGIMGLTGINLDIATVTIAAIALGIVVDDTIHELFLFFEPERRKMKPVEAIVDSLNEAGPAVVATSLIYSLGFLVMIFASMKSVIYFGVLLSMTIMFALICEITLLPATICMFQNSLRENINGTEEIIKKVEEPQAKQEIKNEYDNE